MFRPLVLQMALRYTRPKQKNRFISFSSVASVLGVTLGVATLIVVLSVMNGFDHQVRHKIFDLTPHILITHADGRLSDAAHWVQLAKQTKHVLGAAPYVEGQGMLKRGRDVAPTLVVGIDPKRQPSVSKLDQYLEKGQFTALRPDTFKVVIGQAMADQLGVGIGSKIHLYIPNLTVTPMGAWPQMRALQVAGIFNAGGRMGLDRGAIFINLDDAKALYQLGEHVTGVRVAVDDLYVAPSVAKVLRAHVQYPNWVSAWTQRFESFFKALAMEKTMMFLILTLIVAVAMFNLVSTMVMTIQEKRVEIAVLRTMGMTKANILFTFMLQGLLLGLLGTLIGSVLGVLLALHITDLAMHLQGWLNTQFVNADFYFIDYLPSQLRWHDVCLVVLTALSMSLLATLYPAWRAARVQPVEVLKYEA